MAFLNQIFEYSSSNSKIEHQLEFAIETPWLTCFPKFGSSDQLSKTTFKSPKSYEVKCDVK